MAKYYISADLEGVCGVSSLLQCYPKDDLSGYHDAVDQLADELSAIVEAIVSQDHSAEIRINDAHSRMTNLMLSHLPGNIELLSGKPKKCAMMNGLDDSFDAVMLVGYHARAGTDKGVLNHTFHDKLFDVQVNGVSYGEGGINALYASLVHQVPVFLASGDEAFCQEMAALIPKIWTVETKVGVTTTTALSHPRDLVLQDYRDKTIRMVKDALEWSERKTRQERLLSLQGPYTLDITFTHSLACDVVMTSPLYTRIDGRTVQMTTDDFETLYRSLQASYTMLGYTAYME